MTKPRAALWFVSAGVAIQFAGAIESEMDPISSPMKAKGVGELGLCGVAASLANAVYNATGVRVRDYPITLDKFLDRLPEVV